MGCLQENCSAFTWSPRENGLTLPPPIFLSQIHTGCSTHPVHSRGKKQHINTPPLKGKLRHREAAPSLKTLDWGTHSAGLWIPRGAPGQPWLCQTLTRTGAGRSLRLSTLRSGSLIRITCRVRPACNMRWRVGFCLGLLPHPALPQGCTCYQNRGHHGMGALLTWRHG